MSVVGFDIGTDTCFISIARQGGIEVVANEFSYRHNSTLVSFNQRVRFLGENGKSQLASNVQNTIFGFPLLIARDYNDPDVQETLAMLYAKHCRLDTGAIGITVKYNGEERTFEPVQLLAMLLVQLKAVAESNLKTKVVDCVISCPIFFNDAQRRAMLVASHIAGLNCLRLFNETSAVALTYGIYKKDLPPATEPPRLVAFVDMGKKAFKASICSFSEGKLTVLATVHDSSLGGQNLDRSLFDKFATEFKDKYKIDVHARPKACVRLLAECEKLKKLMSTNATTIPLNIECLMNDVDVRGTCDRAAFEELCAEPLGRITPLLKRLLEQAQVKAEDLYAVEIVGGGTRMPAVKRYIQDVFGREPNTTLNADEAVSRGCALMCAIISPTFKVREFAVTEAQPFHINVYYTDPASGEEKCSEVFPVNHAVPSNRLITLLRSASFDVTARYVDPSLVPGALANIATYSITVPTTPPAAGGDHKIKVRVRINEHGIFVVESARSEEEVEYEVEEKPVAAPAVVPATDATAAAAPATDDAAATAGDAPAPMETDETPAAADAATPAADATPEPMDATPVEPEAPRMIKKKKTVKTPLTVSGTGSREFTTAQRNAFHEAEVQMQLNDRIEKERVDAKNAVEEFVYEMREKLSETYAPFAEESKREELSSALSAAEEWLYDEGEDQPKKVYEAKMADMRKLSDPIVQRFGEASTRPAAIEALQQSCVSYRKIVDLWSGFDERYAHLTDNDMNKLKAELELKEKWMQEKLVAQSRCAQHDTPAVLTDELKVQRDQLERLAKPIVNKPKPKADPPKVEPTPAPAADTPATDATPAADADKKADAMDID